MALLGQTADHPIRQVNKEPEWSNICNNVFDQYLETDDIFGFDTTNGRGRSSSDDSGNLFEFFTGSEQSHQTTGTSPLPSWDYSAVQGAETVVEARQPQAKEPVDFWTKTLRALEQNAAQSERHQQRLRSAKSHPDFLSLGGCPSPPAIPASPADQSLPAPRFRSRGAANGRKASQARSLSRGRPSGVIKIPASAGSTATHPYATVRKCSASPPKMMNPSRYRAGFKDVWADRAAERSPNTKYELRVPSSGHGLPVSPPPSARLGGQYNDNGVGGLAAFVPMLPSAYDEQLSPLTKTFQQAHIHTPIASPALMANAAAYASNYFEEEDVPPFPADLYPTAQSVALNDTAPLYPERTSSLSPQKIQVFDFGFSSSPELEAWSTAPYAEPIYTVSHEYTAVDPCGGLNATVMPSIEPDGLPGPNGLGISCNPSLVSRFSTIPSTTTLPATIYRPQHANIHPYYPPPQPHQVTIPSTPHRRASRRRSDSPTPPLTQPRRARPTSRSRRSQSRQRRTKSTSHPSSTTLDPSSSSSASASNTKASRRGFVNFTPQDSGKLLAGVAPSGSSKTKARREKEALDKRRRFSQAAVRAVVEAGGDLHCLAEAGLVDLA